MERHKKYILHYQVVVGQPNTIHTDLTEDELLKMYSFLLPGSYSHHPRVGREECICAHCCVYRQRTNFHSYHVDPGSILTSYGSNVICKQCKESLDGPFLTVVHYSTDKQDRWREDTDKWRSLYTHLSNFPIEREGAIHDQLSGNSSIYRRIVQMHTVGSREERICNECCRKRLSNQKQELGHTKVTNDNVCVKCEEEYEKEKIRLP